MDSGSRNVVVLVRLCGNVIAVSRGRDGKVRAVRVGKDAGKRLPQPEPGKLLGR